MRLKQLRGLPVIDPTAARKLGTVTDYQVDPTAGRLAALDITPVASGPAERIVAQRIRRVGTHAVILTARGGAMASASAEANERWLDTAALVGLEVLGDDGSRIGHLVDAVFDQDSLEIEAYLLNGSWWEQLLGQRRRIQPEKVHASSRELMIVTTGQVAARDVAPEETAPLEVEPPLPLKEEDRLPAPSFETVPDGHPATPGTKRR
jgi:uncharacterized protein YrrD